MRFCSYLLLSLTVLVAERGPTLTMGLKRPDGGGFRKLSDITRGGSSSRILAKNEKETNLDVAPPLTQLISVDSEHEAPLMRDLNLLSDILSNLVNTEDPKVHDLYEEFRQLGLDRANDPNNVAALNKMIKRAGQISANEIAGVMRTFSIMLNLVNTAEVQHRTRITKEYHRNTTDDKVGPLPIVEDSMRGTFDALLKSGKTSDEIYNQLLRQKVEIVLTAHPTQVQRKSLLRKYLKVGTTLTDMERQDLNLFERQSAVSELRRIISSIWGADEIRRQKPTPQQEAAGGNAIIESVLWHAVPAYLRKLDLQCEMSLGKRLPIECVPIKFASWIGGDRDGNPNVTPEVTLEVVLQQRLRATRLLVSDLYNLLSHLAISVRFSKEMEELAASIQNSPHQREKYRRVIGHLIDRLVVTSREIETELSKITNDNYIPQTEPNDFSESGRAIDRDSVKSIMDGKDLLDPLLIMHRSLRETGFGLVADGLLSDTIRRVSVFGMSLVPLDIREESTRHTDAIDAITRWLGIGSYKEWSEEARITWLVNELSNKRPLFPIRDLGPLNFSETVVKTIRTFAVASSLAPSALGAYVISQAQTASDVLAVMLLQKQYGMTPDNGNMMRIVPLFETLTDLTNASDVLRTLFSIPYYVGAVNNKQEVMVGYSDSAKDAGRLAACWSQYVSQEKMSAVASKFSIELTFFHGKGGTVGRGGNPSVYRAIMSHPPNTINGRFRVTEQGEMITQNFGTIYIAERTLDTYTSAVCREYFVQHVDPKEEWRIQMQRLSDVSCQDYRELVREEPRFVPYFRQATPELELGALNIGSRPAKRNPKGGVDSLRAIPWTFAWTQTRLHLSAWLGVGKALHTDKADELATLRDMYKQWPWFRETIDLIAMILSKTDFSISKNYDEQLVERTDGLMKLGEEIREKLVETRRAVLNVTESKDVAGAHVALQRASSQIRHPYVDPVNVMQAEVLKRVRSMEKRTNLTASESKELETLKDALIISINAIAQGMKNSG